MYLYCQLLRYVSKFVLLIVKDVYKNKKKFKISIIKNYVAQKFKKACNNKDVYDLRLLQS